MAACRTVSSSLDAFDAEESLDTHWSFGAKRWAFNVFTPVDNGLLKGLRFWSGAVCFERSQAILDEVCLLGNLSDET